MSEQQMQNIILEDIKSIGGYGFKTSSRYMVGVPDLYLTTPIRGGLFIECKFIKNISKFEAKMSVKTTPKQRQILKRLNDFGTIAVVLIGYKIKEGNRNVWYFLECNHDTITFDNKALCPNGRKRDITTKYTKSGWLENLLKDIL